MFPSPDNSRGTQVRPPLGRGWEAAYPALGEAAHAPASRRGPVATGADGTTPDAARLQPAASGEGPSWRAIAGRALGLARAFLLLEDPALESRHDSAAAVAVATATAGEPRRPDRRSSPGRPHELADPRMHPHRRPPRPRRRPRRPGATAPRPQPCLSVLDPA